MLPISLLSWIVKRPLLLLSVIILILLGLLYWAGGRIGELEAQLAAKPEVEVQERIVVKEIRGPERIKEVIVTQPGGACTVERTIERGAVEVVTATEKDLHSKPGALQAPYRRILGLGINEREHLALRGGLTFFGRLDLSYSKTVPLETKYFRFDEGHLFEAAWRF